MPAHSPTPHRGHSPLEVLAVALRLGLTSFGGPIAHLGYFRNEYVLRRRWLDEVTYAELVALCQFLPGPASSQLGIAIGILRAGLLGGVMAWVGFTLPSAIALVVFGLAVRDADLSAAGWLRGLEIAAVAVVAQAVWGMARALCPDRLRATIAIAAAVAVTAWPAPSGHVLVIAAAAFLGVLVLAAPDVREAPTPPVAVARPIAVAALVAFLALLAGLPIAVRIVPAQSVAVFDSFYRAGALVFGGGHVVLPLLQAEVVPPGWVSDEQFIAGYGAAQAVPGPLFTFAAYLGAVMRPSPNGVAGAALCLTAIFLPAFLLVIGTLPFWDALRRMARFQTALAGVNAAVVGVLLGALYDPVWTGAIRSAADFALALATFGLLALWRVPPWGVVALAAAGAEAIRLSH
jgi:chromate transporter